VEWTSNRNWLHSAEEIETHALSCSLAVEQVSMKCMMCSRLLKLPRDVRKNMECTECKSSYLLPLESFSSSKFGIAAVPFPVFISKMKAKAKAKAKNEKRKTKNEMRKAKSKMKTKTSNNQQQTVFITIKIQELEPPTLDNSMLLFLGIRVFERENEQLVYFFRTRFKIIYDHLLQSPPDHFLFF